MTNRNTYYYHLNGLKGIACLLVMVGHYLGLYKRAQSFLPSIHALDVLNNSIFSFTVDEGYWLYLFFVVSGYLVSKSNILNVKDLFSKSINRFLRLGIPVLFSYFIIYLIYLVIGFHNGETKSLFQCRWFQNYYIDSYTIKDVLLSPFYVIILRKCDLNAPYWVLRMMFASSLLIYALKYLFVKLKKLQNESVGFSTLFIITILSCALSPIITACLAGMLVSLYENSGIKTSRCYAFWFLFVSMSIYFLPGTLKSAIFFAALIIFTPRLKLLNCILSSKPVQFLGNICWDVYSFHWPIMCSVGALSIIWLSKNIGLTASYFISFIVVLVSTFVLSVLFYYSFERFADKLTKKINGIVLKILKVR